MGPGASGADLEAFFFLGGFDFCSETADVGCEGDELDGWGFPCATGGGGGLAFSTAVVVAAFAFFPFACFFDSV